MIVNCHFSHISNRSMALIDVRILFMLNILITNGQNLTIFCVYIDIDKLKIGIGMHDFSQIYSRVMALD